MAVLLGILGMAAAAVPFAAAGPPPGQNTLFFSPSGSGGCSDGQVSAIGEASTQWGASVTPVDPGITPQVVTPSNPLIGNQFSGGNGSLATMPLYAGGMAATGWTYTLGDPWVFSGVAPAWATQVYFTQSRTCANTQWLYAACYSTIASSEFNPNTLIQCPKPTPTAGPPDSTWMWVTYQAPSGSVMGGGVAVDTTSNVVYFTTVPSGCTGTASCTATVWSAPAATSDGAMLQATPIATLPGFGNPTELAVDGISQLLFLAGPAKGQVVSLPTAPGGTQSVLLSGTPWISGGTVSGLAVDPATATVYVLSAQTGDEPSQIAQVPESGCCARALFTGDAMGESSLPTALAVDSANGFAAWSTVPQGATKTGSANQLLWGPLDGSPSSGAGAQTYGWLGAPDASTAAYVGGLALAGGVGTCQYEGASFPCPTTTVAAAGTTAWATGSGKVSIPLRAVVVRPGASSSAIARGPMVVTIRERSSAGHAARTFATLRPGFSLKPNTQQAARVAVPQAARAAMRAGRLEVRVQTRPAGFGQRWRTRVLRVRPR